MLTTNTDLDPDYTEVEDDSSLSSSQHGYITNVMTPDNMNNYLFGQSIVGEADPEIQNKLRERKISLETEEVSPIPQQAPDESADIEYDLDIYKIPSAGQTILNKALLGKYTSSVVQPYGSDEYYKNQNGDLWEEAKAQDQAKVSSRVQELIEEVNKYDSTHWITSKYGTALLGGFVGAYVDPLTTIAYLSSSAATYAGVRGAASVLGVAGWQGRTAAVALTVGANYATNLAIAKEANKYRPSIGIEESNPYTEAAENTAIQIGLGGFFRTLHRTGRNLLNYSKKDPSNVAGFTEWQKQIDIGETENFADIPVSTSPPTPDQIKQNYKNWTPQGDIKQTNDIANNTPVAAPVDTTKVQLLLFNQSKKDPTQGGTTNVPRGTLDETQVPAIDTNVPRGTLGETQVPKQVLVPKVPNLDYAKMQDYGITDLGNYYSVEYLPPPIEPIPKTIEVPNPILDPVTGAVITDIPETIPNPAFGKEPEVAAKPKPNYYRYNPIAGIETSEQLNRLFVNGLKAFINSRSDPKEKIRTIRRHLDGVHKATAIYNKLFVTTLFDGITYAEADITEPNIFSSAGGLISYNDLSRTRNNKDVLEHAYDYIYNDALMGDIPQAGVVKKLLDNWKKKDKIALTAFHANGKQIQRLYRRFPNSHNRTIMRGKHPQQSVAASSWANKITPLLDLERMSKALGVPKEKIDLEEMFDSIVDQNIGSISADDFKHRQLFFKDGESYVKYHEMYGNTVDLISILMDDMGHQASSLGYTQQLGTFPQETLAALRKMNEENGLAVDSIAWNFHETRRVENMISRLETPRGIEGRYGAYKIIQALEAVAKPIMLANAFVWSLVYDPIMRLFASSQMGVNIFKAMSQVFKSYVGDRNFRNKVNYILSNDRFYTNPTHEFAESNTAISKWFSKWLPAGNGLMRNNKHRATLDFRQTLGEDSILSWEQLSPKKKTYYSKRLSPAEWDLMWKERKHLIDRDFPFVGDQALIGDAIEFINPYSAFSRAKTTEAKVIIRKLMMLEEDHVNFAINESNTLNHVSYLGDRKLEWLAAHIPFIGATLNMWSKLTDRDPMKMIASAAPYFMIIGLLQSGVKDMGAGRNPFGWLDENDRVGSISRHLARVWMDTGGAGTIVGGLGTTLLDYIESESDADTISKIQQVARKKIDRFGQISTLGFYANVGNNAGNAIKQFADGENAKAIRSLSKIAPWTRWAYTDLLVQRGLVDNIMQMIDDNADSVFIDEQKKASELKRPQMIKSGSFAGSDMTYTKPRKPNL